MINKNRVKFLGLAAAGALLIGCESPEEKVERLYLSGVEFLDEGDLGRANVQFQNVLQENDTHVPTLMGLAQIAEAQSNFEAMFGTLQTVVRLDEDNIEARWKLGQLYLIGGDETEALSQAEAALELDSNNIGALMLKSAVLLRLGDKVGAKEIADAVVAREPGNEEAATVISTIYAQNGDLDAAIAELDRVLMVTPESAVLQLLRIRLLGQLDRTDDVLLGFQKLTELFPEEPTYRRTYGAALFTEDRFDEAVVEFEKALELEPANTALKLDIIRLIVRAEGAEAAEKRFLEMIEGESEDRELSFSLVDFYLQSENFDRAFEVLEDLAASQDVIISTRAKSRIAGLELRNGNRDVAESLIDEVLSGDATNVEALILRAQLQLEDDLVDDAVANLRTALNSDPDSYQAMVLMARAMQQQGNRDLARTELAKGFEASRNNAEVGRLFAGFLFEDGRPARAAEVLEQVLQNNPNDIDTLKMLARARLSTEDWLGAEEIANLIESIGDSEQDAALNIRALALTGSEEYNQVIDLLNKPAEKATVSAAAPLAILTRAYIQEERYDEALEALDAVIAEESENYLARMLRSSVFEAKGDKDALLASLNETTTVIPDRADAYVSLFRVHLADGDVDTAEAIIDRGIANAPNAGALKVYKADILLTRGAREEALEIYEGIISIFGGNRVVVNNYISLTNSLRTDEESRKRALSFVPVIENEQNPYFQDTVGWAYYLAGQPQRAVGFLENAVEGAPQLAEIHYHYGAVKLAMGEVDLGREHLEKALEIGGADFEFKDAVNALLER